MSARTYDINGWPEIKGNPISRVGVFPYDGKFLGGAAEPGRIYMVYRPAEELGSQETIDSFKLMPFVDEHPEALMGDEKEGFVDIDDKPARGVIGQEVYFSEDDGILYGNLKIFSGKAHGKIAGGKREVSAGYRCKYVREPGIYNGVSYEYIQRNMRGNHVALVDEGRSGHDIAVLDHLQFSFDTKELEMADPDKKPEDDKGTGQDELTLEGLAAQLETLKPALEMLRKLQDDVAKLLSADPVKEEEVKEEKLEEVVLDEAEEGEEEIKVALDSANAAKLRKFLKRQAKPSTPAMDAAAIHTEIALKQSLYDGVSVHVGAFDASGMDSKAVAAYGIDKLGIKGIPAGAEVAGLQAVLAHKPKPAKPVLGSGMDKKDEPNAITAHLNKKED